MQALGVISPDPLGQKVRGQPYSLHDSQDFIARGGTFLNPGVNDESNNWANRGHLLDVYRRLVAEMKKAGIYQALS